MRSLQQEFSNCLIIPNRWAVTRSDTRVIWNSQLQNRCDGFNKKTAENAAHMACCLFSRKNNFVLNFGTSRTIEDKKSNTPETVLKTLQSRTWQNTVKKFALEKTLWQEAKKNSLDSEVPHVPFSFRIFCTASVVKALVPRNKLRICYLQSESYGYKRIIPLELYNFDFPIPILPEDHKSWSCGMLIRFRTMQY